MLWLRCSQLPPSVRPTPCVGSCHEAQFVISHEDDGWCGFADAIKPPKDTAERWFISHLALLITLWNALVIKAASGKWEPSHPHACLETQMFPNNMADLPCLFGHFFCGSTHDRQAYKNSCFWGTSVWVAVCWYKCWKAKKWLIWALKWPLYTTMGRLPVSF